MFSSPLMDRPSFWSKNDSLEQRLGLKDGIGVEKSIEVDFDGLFLV